MKKVHRKVLRKKFLELLGKRYCFWALYLKNFDAEKKDENERNLKSFVDQHFRILVGHVFQPKGMKDCLLLALEKGEKDFVKQDEAYERLRPVIEDKEIRKKHKNSFSMLLHFLPAIRPTIVTPWGGDSSAFFALLVCGRRGGSVL